MSSQARFVSRTHLSAWVSVGCASLALLLGARGGAQADEVPIVVPAGQVTVAARASEAAQTVAARLGLAYQDGGSHVLLSDGGTRVRLFPNSNRLSLDGEERMLRGTFVRGPQGVTIPGPAVGIIEQHVGQARARIAAQKAPVVMAPRPRPTVVAPVAAPPPMLPRPAAAAPMASSVEPDAGWAVSATARPWKWIILHHSDDTSGNLAKYHRVHLEKGWEHGCGYHFVIGNGSLSGDGQVEMSQRWLRQLHGAHAKTPDNRFNDYGIGITLVGDFERGTAKPTAAQMRALVRLTQWLMDRYGIPEANVQGHCACKATCCPGRNFPWTELRAKLRDPAQVKVAVAPGPAALGAGHDDHAAPAAAPLRPTAATLPPAAAPAWLPGAPATGASVPPALAGPRGLPTPPPLGLPPTGALPPR